MAALYNPGDLVYVKKSKSGYTGPGELVSIAFGSFWLVKKLEPDGKNLLCLVNAKDLKHEKAGR